MDLISCHFWETCLVRVWQTSGVVLVYGGSPGCLVVRLRAVFTSWQSERFMREAGFISCVLWPRRGSYDIVRESSRQPTNP
jgi:hypothetical protein